MAEAWTARVVRKDIDPKAATQVTTFLSRVGLTAFIPETCRTKDFYSNHVGGHLKVHKIERGTITCHLSVNTLSPYNYWGGIHEGAVEAIEERVAIACARTVIAEDREIFLGGLTISYLLAAPKNAELIVDGRVVKSGKTVTVVAIEFKFKETGKPASTAQATFYNIPLSNL